MNILKHFKKKMKCKGGFIGTSIAIGSAILGGTLAGGAALTGAAALGAGLVGGATLLAGGLAIGSLAKGVFGGGGDVGSPAGLPASPSFEEAQGTSLEEQRDNLRGKSKTNLSSNNLLTTEGNTSQKTLLGS
jgi:hypothetical protein